jgi:hypothetical protein
LAEYLDWSVVVGLNGSETKLCRVFEGLRSMASHRFAGVVVGGEIQRGAHDESELAVIADESNAAEVRTLLDRSEGSKVINNFREEGWVGGCHGCCS